LQNTDEIQHLLSQHTTTHKFRVLRPENYKQIIHSHTWTPECYLSSRIKNPRHFRGQKARSAPLYKRDREREYLLWWGWWEQPISVSVHRTRFRLSRFSPSIVPPKAEILISDNGHNQDFSHNYHLIPMSQSFKVSIIQFSSDVTC